ncbi:MAG: type II secretion system F family protein [Clostridiales bacterium]|nr:type II secretion system F family protein [Clostridiales bacterium]
MTLLIIASMALSFTVIVILFEGIGRKSDNRNRRLKAICGKSPVIDEELDIPFTERFFAPIFYGIIKTFLRILPKNNPKETSQLEKKIKLAGITISVQEYSAAKLMAMLLTITITVIAAFLIDASTPAKLFVFLFGSIIAISGPSFYLSTRIKKRQAFIRNQMPDIMDLLTVCVEAGLGFDAALLKINERFVGPFVDELMIVGREIQMALPRRDALKNLADRNGLPELKTFIGALIQADQMGLPIKNVLRAQSSQLRLTRKQVAEEKGMKAPIKMMLPLILFVFPVIFIVLLGPTILQLIKTFS